LITLLAWRSPLIVLSSISAAWIVLSLLAAKEVGSKALLFPAVLVMHHAWYGVNFLIGLASRSLDANRDPTAACDWDLAEPVPPSGQFPARKPL
jgi:hypothetical protein